MQKWPFWALLLWNKYFICLPMELNASIRCYDCKYAEVTGANTWTQIESYFEEDSLKLMEDQQGRRPKTDPSCKSKPTVTCVGTAGCVTVTKIEPRTGYWVRGCKGPGKPSSGCHLDYPGLYGVPCFCKTDLCNGPSLDFYKIDENNNNTKNDGGTNNGQVHFIALSYSLTLLIMLIN